jgi:GNAT superfamily N-acetyltransferase
MIGNAAGDKRSSRPPESSSPTISAASHYVLTGTGFLPDHHVTVRVRYADEGVSDYLSYTTDSRGRLRGELPVSPAAESLCINASDHRPDPGGACGLLWSNTANLRGCGGECGPLSGPHRCAGGPGGPEWEQMVDQLVLPATGIVVRPARPDDGAAGLVFAAAPTAYSAVAGSEARARAAIDDLWRSPGHSASFEHAVVAESDGEVVGVLIGFPVRDRYRLHLALLRKGLRYVRPRRWPLILLGLPELIAATPRPPRQAYYVGTIAVARHARRRDIASTLGYHAELLAYHGGFPLIVAHTGSRHLPARRALERYGLRATKDRAWGYVLYVKAVGDPARYASAPEFESRAGR